MIEYATQMGVMSGLDIWYAVTRRTDVILMVGRLFQNGRVSALHQSTWRIRPGLDQGSDKRSKMMKLVNLVH
ncbi:hypothetical protein N7468_004245 [Penicillium chermesinum]|uniref:Uncharacterized protein n=1 Tax=Penicillium chermesinum TaxID=63820 RepID=A0A9W9P7Y4_9EURO|nr:uncharacterized protein N7468_004245 [Penicillium chermesinum]KAJ5239626.1 hypothetical protein N7468_004245 [Penicillium chermesinum]